MTARYRLKGTAYTVSPLEGPLEQSGNEEIFTAIGRFIAEWSRMEHLITMLALHVNKEAANAALYDPNPQVSFKKLTELLQKWLIDDSQLRNLVKLDPKFLDCLIEYSDTRNFLAHGFLSSADNGELTLSMVRHSAKDAYTLQSRQIKLEGIIEGASHLKTATLALIEIANVVFIPEPRTKTENF